jgi:hypothetical protein
VGVLKERRQQKETEIKCNRGERYRNKRRGRDKNPLVKKAVKDKK